LSLGAKNAQSVRPAVRVLSQLSEWLERSHPELTPDKLTRRHLEDFLIAQHLSARGGALAPSDHERGIVLLKKFLDDALPLGLTDPRQPLAGLPASCRLTRDDLIARRGPADPEDEAGRSLPEAIMAQLFTPACLGLLNPEQQRLLIIAAETGRRPGEICGLRFNCLEYESDSGQRLPVLVHDQPKARRSGVRLPISAKAAEAIRAQQDWIRSRYVATASADLALFPRKSRNAHGRHPMTSSSLTSIVVAWRDQLQLHEASVIEGRITPLRDAAGQPVPFPKQRLTAYAFRHTYAQRMIDAGVQVTVLQDLMGHRSIDTTQGYYRVRAKQKRDALEAVARYQLNLDTHLPAIPVGSTRAELGSISTPMGYCTEPSNVRTFGRSCQFRHRCFGCIHFRTDVSFLADLTAYLSQLLVAREELSESHPEIAEWARRDAMPSGEEIATVRGLIDACHQLLESLEPDQRSELLGHIETLREIRQHVTDSVPVQLLRSVSPPEPTVFPRLASEEK
jgi:integrase